MTYQSKKVFSIGVAVFLSMACVGVHCSEVAAAAGAADLSALPSHTDPINILLHQAVQEGDEDKCKEFILLADINVQNLAGNTALHIAAQNGNLNIVTLLIASDADISLKNKYEKRAVDIARDRHDLSIASLLCERQVFIDKKFKAALVRNTLENVFYLINCGADVNAQNSYGNTALHLAVMNGNVAVIIKLRQHNARVDIKNKAGKTPSDLARELHPYDDSIAHAFSVSLDSSSLPFASAAEESAGLESKIHTAPFQSGEDNSLIEAVRRGDLNAVKRLLASKGCRESIENRDAQDDASLHIAAQGGHLEVVKHLIAKGANVDAQNRAGDTSLHIAVKKIFFGVVKHLIAKGANVNAQNSAGDTPLHIALKERFFDVVKKLIAKGANVDAQNRAGDTPLHIAVREGFFGVFKQLIAKGANVNVQNSAGDTSLHIAVKLPQLFFAKELLLVGAKTDIENHKGETPYSLAKAENQLLLMGAMKQNRAIVNPLAASQPVASASGDALLSMTSAEMHDFKPSDLSKDRLFAAVIYGRVAQLRALLKNSSVDINAKYNEGNTLLHCAVRRGDLRVVQIIMSKFPDISLKNDEGKMPVDIAGEGNFTEIKRLLTFSQENLNKDLSMALEDQKTKEALSFINLGADVNAQNSHSQTALHLAVLGGDVDLLDMLIKKNADVDIKDSLGETALHLAAMIGNVSTIEKLIAYNADVNIKNNAGKTPMDLACEHHPYDDSIAYAFQVPLDSSSLPFASAAEESAGLDGEPVQQKQQKRARVDD